MFPARALPRMLFLFSETIPTSILPPDRLLSCARATCRKPWTRAVAHLSAIKGRVPFLPSFDGFRSSHEIQKIETGFTRISPNCRLDSVDAFAALAHPEHPYCAAAPRTPISSSRPENPPIPITTRFRAWRGYMAKVNAKSGPTTSCSITRRPEPNTSSSRWFRLRHHEETIDYLNAKGGKYGLIKVRLYRPFLPKN
jgi:pyruvate-ferredoxin/flavodoxin oxidoreductase